MLSGSLMDYGIPRVDTLPPVDFSPIPSTTNPLGAKGVGEGGTVASMPTVMNAILDALAPLGVTDVPMPATPERIWRAIREHAPSTPHSITSSARASNVGGMVRFSKRAVFMLMYRSYLIGCSTGMSAGLAPLMILSICAAA
jgi:hypothetical protein